MIAVFDLLIVFFFNIALSKKKYKKIQFFSDDILKKKYFELYNYYRLIKKFVSFLKTHFLV